MIRDLEGTDKLSDETLQEYADDTTEKHRKMVEVMGQQLQLTSLKFQRLQDVVDAIGLPKSELCTHCWDNSSYME